MMQLKEITSISQLKRGDIVRGKFSGRTYVVNMNIGSAVIATDVAFIDRPKEWQLLDFSDNECKCEGKKDGTV